jgi:tetratricopeptide (TPR) repeat protein
MPAIPEEVSELVGRAIYAFKNAASPSDYEQAIDAYSRALVLAPWVAKNYYNLAVVQEKAGKPEDAIRSFRWYMLSAPNASDVDEVRERIGGLKFASEKLAAERSQRDAAADAERGKRETFEEFKRAVQGVHYKVLFCTSPEFAQRHTDGGCTWREYNGSNFYDYADMYPGNPWPYFYWVFHDGYATLECSSGNCTPIRARATGAGMEYMVFDQQSVIEPLPDQWFPRPLMGWTSNPLFGSFTLSTAPSRAEAEANPDKHYHYYNYQAIK